MHNQIETHIIGGIQKFSLEDGPGIRTTVFTKGCPLKCKWCHNPELINPEIQILWNQSKCIGDRSCLNICQHDAITCQNNVINLDWSKCTHCMRCSEICYAKALTAVGMRMTVEEILRIVMQDIGFYKNTGGGLTISGGEVLSNIDLALDLAKGAKSKGINIALDTSGYGKYEQLHNLAEVCDYILYDMKTIIDEKHIEMTGVSNEIILNSLVKLTKDEKLRKKIIMRMPLIRGINDDDETLATTIKFYLENGLTEVNLLAYHNLGISKKQNIGERPEEFEAPEDSQMQRIKKMFIDAGIHTTIMGEKQ